MDRTLESEEFAKNIYVIKSKLAALKPLRSNGGRYDYAVGNFNVVIWAFPMGDAPPDKLESLVQLEKVDVVLNEFNKEGHGSVISLRDDSRFKNYEPIQYNVIESPGGRINLSNGDNMPILHLCELIRYLHRLSNLTAFM